MYRGRVATAALLLVALILPSGGTVIAQDETAPPPDSVITWTPGANDGVVGKLFDPVLASVDAALASNGNVVIVSGQQLKSGYIVPAVWTSMDGVTWTRATLNLPKKWQGSFPSGAVLTSVVANPEGLTAVGGDVFGSGFGLTATSADGMEWSLQRREEIAKLVAVEPRGSGLAVLANHACPNRKACQKSGGLGYPAYLDANEPDVATWSTKRIVDKGQPSFLAVSPEDVLLVAGYKNARGDLALWRSTDGMEWSAVSPVSETPIEGFATDLAWTPAGFVMTVGDGRRQGAAWVSPDGLSWERVIDSDGQVSAVGTTAEDTFVFGDDRYWRTSDGITWDEIAAPEFGHSVIDSLVAMSDGKAVLVGTSGPQVKQPEIKTWIGVQEMPAS